MKKLVGWLATLAILIAIVAVFLYAPVEKNMGIVQKIFYFHVGAAWIAFLAFFVTFVSSIAYLIKRRDEFDLSAGVSAEIGVIYTTIVLVTGPIWGKVAWNAWWTWDPRLTTTLILWFIYAAYLVLRGLHSERTKVYSAVFGIIGFIDVPIVFMSIRWWRTIHPVVVEATGFSLETEMIITLFISLAAFTLLYLYYFLTRYQMGNLSRKIEKLQTKIGGQK